MLEAHQNWFIATKQIEAISSRLQQELEGLGCEVLHDPMYLHAHFFIPEDVYPHADETMKAVGLTLTDEHPPICSIGHKDGFEVFEKRMPIIEVREADALRALFDQGVSMSGGAGRPHIHVKIPDEKRQDVLEFLSEHKFISHKDYPSACKA